MSAPPRRMYLDPTDEDARRLFQRGIEGPLLMLNLLRFREIADYSDFPDLARLSRSLGVPPTTDMFDTRSCSSPRAAGRSSSTGREVTPSSARPMSVGIV